jgi:outer membrane protein OmpA-like peptidoglycan-associated protein
MNYPIHLVEIAGHTDSVGNVDYNVKLSERRASSVKQYLIKKGIDPNKVVTKGYGPTDPVADNETEEGRAKNRRVELIILK